MNQQDQLACNHASAQLFAGTELADGRAALLLSPRIRYPAENLSDLVLPAYCGAVFLVGRYRDAEGGHAASVWLTDVPICIAAWTSLTDLNEPMG